MIPIYLYLVGSSLLGFGFWLGRTSGRTSEQRNREQIIDDVVRRRMGWRDTEPDALPVQLGTLPEHQRRLAIAASQTPIGAEPAVGRSGLTSPAAAGAAVTTARTSGNAAPPLDAQSPPRTGGPAGPLRPWLVTTLAYRRAQLLVALDRAVAPLRSSTGRHRAEDMPRLYGTVAQRRHSAAEHQREVHLAWATSTAEWPTLALARGWTVPDIPPTVELGELVRTGG